MSLFKNLLLVCGCVSAIIYPLTDVIAGTMYKGYSFHEQAVSELFAIGSPVAPFVVVFFSMSSILLFFFSLGIFLAANRNKLMILLACLVFANALDSIILWNFFPMHMRHMAPTFTDKMHTILAINPFIVISIIIGAFLYNNWFRSYSLFTIAALVIPAIISFSYIPLLLSHQPTPWMGISERISQYSHLTWLAMLSIQIFTNNSYSNNAVRKKN